MFDGFVLLELQGRKPIQVAFIGMDAGFLTDVSLHNCLYRVLVGLRDMEGAGLPATLD